MAIRKILLEKEPTLRKVSRPVDNFNDRLWELLDDLADTLKDAQGLGLAAPQVGILRRVVIVDMGQGAIELINPVILKTHGEVEDAEGCLSSPGEYGYVVRPKWVRVKAQDRNGNSFEIEGEGILARAFCHELDHLDGRLFKDLVIRMVEDDD